MKEREEDGCSKTKTGWGLPVLMGFGRRETGSETEEMLMLEERQSVALSWRVISLLTFCG